MMTNHKVNRMLLIVLLCTVALLLTSIDSRVSLQTAQAATACTGYQVLFDGTYPKSTAYGVRANINTKIPALCGASHSASAIWDMVAGGNTDCEWAQAGYHRIYGDSNVVYFAQYRRDCSVQPVTRRWTVASGTHNYRTWYSRSEGRMYMQVDTTTILTTNFDPALYWHSGWNAQWEGEVHDGGDDIAGTPSSPVYFSNLKWQTTPGGSWVTPTGLSIGSDSPRYGRQWDIQNSKFHVWTK